MESIDDDNNNDENSSDALRETERVIKEFNERKEWEDEHLIGEDDKTKRKTVPRHDIDEDTKMVKIFLERQHQNSSPTLKSIKEFDDEIFGREWREFLQRDWEYKLDIFRRAGNANIEGIRTAELRDLYTEYVSEPVELQPVIVSGISRNEAMSEMECYRCRYCDMRFEFPHEPSMSEKDKLTCVCHSRNDKPMLEEYLDKKYMVDIQWIRVQEIRRNRRTSKTPLTIPCLMKGRRFMWSVSLNERIRPKGFLRYWIVKDKSTGKKTRIPWFEIYEIKRVDRGEWDVELTESDTEYIKYEMSQPGFFKKLLSSFAPQINGMEALKECALLTLASVKMKRPLRVLVVGDPSVGKSDIMEYASNILADSYYVVMSDARKTGLTTTSQKDPDTDTWMVEPGVFASADGSAIWIDEFQQGKAEDITALNYVVERGKIYYALAGGNHGEFDANAAIMISCNAHTGMIGSEENIHELMKFVGKGLPAFLSRMNLVLFMRTDYHEDTERSIADQMYENAEEDAVIKYDSDWNNDNCNYYDTQTIRKIIKYVIENVPVEGMPPEYKDRFIDYYIKNREDVTARVNKLISRRYMRHSITLSQAFARLQGRSKPNEDDINHVFELLEKHMSIAAFDPKTQEIDTNMLNGNLAKSKISEMNKEAQLEEGIEMAMKGEDGNSSKGYFTEDELVFVMQTMPNSKWQSDGEVERAIQKLLMRGKLMEKSQGKFTPI